jgi:4-hydroxy-tetrahydrodipicolinate reductase
MTTLKVVAWSTGNAGRHAIAGIDARPELELVGVWVSNPDKVGQDAGQLAGLGRDLGVLATHDADALIALKPDCIVHTAIADNRLAEALADLQKFLRAGINVVSSAPVYLQYPYGVIREELIKPLQEAAEAGGVSLWVNGIDPGWANDWLPLIVTSGSERIDEVRCYEIADYSTYDNGPVVQDIMGFGRPLEDTPILLLPGVLTMAWGSVVRQLAAGLGVELDTITETHARIPAPEDIDVSWGRIPAGTTAALRFEVLGIRNGRSVVALEHVTRMRPDLAPDWPQPAGVSCYRVEVTGEPTYTLDLQFMAADGDHNTAGLKGTSMRLVNAVEAVVAAPPGLITALDLPLITGRGLVR